MPLKEPEALSKRTLSCTCSVAGCPRAAGRHVVSCFWPGVPGGGARRRRAGAWLGFRAKLWRNAE